LRRGDVVARGDLGVGGADTDQSAQRGADTGNGDRTKDVHHGVQLL
jgi:hypothetical protein